jgi:hypothetical protein
MYAAGLTEARHGRLDRVRPRAVPIAGGLGIVVVMVLAGFLLPAAGAAPASVSNPPSISGYHLWVLNYDPTSQQVFGTAEGKTPANVSVFNGTTGQFITGVPAGSRMLGYVLEPLGLDRERAVGFVEEPGNHTGKIGVFSTKTLHDLPGRSLPGGCPGAGPTFDRVVKLVFVNCGRPNGSSPIYGYLLNATSLQVVATVPLGNGSGSPEYGPGVDVRTGDLFQPLDGRGAIAVVDPSQARVVATITHLPTNLMNPLFDARANEFFAFSHSSAVAVIDAATDRVVANFSIPGNVVSVAPIWNASEFAVLSDLGCSGCSDHIYYVNTTGVILGNQSLPSASSVSITYDAADGKVWVADPYSVGWLYLRSPIY